MADLLVDLSERVAVVTGAAGGLGRASAEALSRAGAAVVCADVQAGACDAVAAAIGGLATAWPTDVTKRDSVRRLVTETMARHGRIDVFCNFAGIIHTGAVLDTAEADLKRVHDVNFMGAFFGCQAAAEVMVQQGRGSIVNVLTSTGDSGAPTYVAYATSKVAVAELSRTLATEVGPFGVRVNSVAPGFVPSPMTARHWTSPNGTVRLEDEASYIARMAAAVPLRRVGTPQDVANAVLFLASDASSFMTGQILRPNGGVVMP